MTTRMPFWRLFGRIVPCTLLVAGGVAAAAHSAPGSLCDGATGFVAGVVFQGGTQNPICPIIRSDTSVNLGTVSVRVYESSVSDATPITCYVESHNSSFSQQDYSVEVEHSGSQGGESIVISNGSYTHYGLGGAYNVLCYSLDAGDILSNYRWTE